MGVTVQMPVLGAMGWIEVICGSMFSGKTEELIRRINREKIARQKVQVFKPKLDNRFSNDHVVSHSSLAFNAINIENPEEILSLVEDNTRVVGIDEAQFFKDLKQFVEYSTDHLGKDVLVVGLDGDADRKPFGQILDCIPLADKVTKLTAFCKRCGDGTEAIFSFCNQKKTEQVCVGGAEMYMPLCRKHYLMGMYSMTVL